MNRTNNLVKFMLFDVEKLMNLFKICYCETTYLPTNVCKSRSMEFIMKMCSTKAFGLKRDSQRYLNTCQNNVLLFLRHNYYYKKLFDIQKLFSFSYGNHSHPRTI